jgi:hypothetical protein
VGGEESGGCGGQRWEQETHGALGSGGSIPRNVHAQVARNRGALVHVAAVAHECEVDEKACKVAQCDAGHLPIERARMHRAIGAINGDGGATEPSVTRAGGALAVSLEGVSLKGVAVCRGLVHCGDVSRSWVAGEQTARGHEDGSSATTHGVGWLPRHAPGCPARRPCREPLAVARRGAPRAACGIRTGLQRPNRSSPSCRHSTPASPGSEA